MTPPRALLTLLPPPADWGEGRIADYLEHARRLLLRLGEGAALNVPEVLPHAGRGERPLPFRPKLGLIPFARRLRALGLRVYLDRYAPIMGKGEFRRFLLEARGVAEGIVVVGKVSSQQPTLGYDVLEAIGVAREYYEEVGAITIPGREGEVGRVCAKVEAGANFLVSQITFSPEAVRELVRDLRRRCGRMPRLYVSVAPVFAMEDVSLLRWMGVESPEGPKNIFQIARTMAEIPGVYGLNYEHLRYSNLRRLSDPDVSP